MLYINEDNIWVCCEFCNNMKIKVFDLKFIIFKLCNIWLRLVGLS